MPDLTYLEMRSALAVNPIRLSAENDVMLRPIDGDRVRDLTLAVGQGFRWPSQTWSAQQWRRYLATSTMKHWVGEHANSSIGILSLNTAIADEIEIDSFGLLPEFIGQGLGAAFLTVALRLIWEMPINRVWLHTSSDDHPNAYKNYVAHGFAPFVQVSSPGRD